ncbi:hypothetical protein TNCV_3277361 [Trichonephila clavipes]|nr:hypothetical protein TNCV_3277361 [Trichonephila clavipes]
MIVLVRRLLLAYIDTNGSEWVDRRTNNTVVMVSTCEVLLLRQVCFDNLSVASCGFNDLSDASCVSDGFWLLFQRIDGITSAPRRLLFSSATDTNEGR